MQARGDEAEHGVSEPKEEVTAVSTQPWQDLERVRRPYIVRMPNWLLIVFLLSVEPKAQSVLPERGLSQYR